MSAQDLPDEDQEPLEPPEALIPISPDVVADGRGVVALPCTNPRLSPTLDVCGFPGIGWYVRVQDAFGTVVFSVMLKGMRPDELPG
jgi:hypothetical protein